MDDSTMMDSDSCNQHGTDECDSDGTGDSSDDSANHNFHHDATDAPAPHPNHDPTPPLHGEKVRIAIELLQGLNLEKAREAALALDRDLEHQRTRELEKAPDTAKEEPSASLRVSFDRRPTTTVDELGDIMRALNSMNGKSPGTVDIDPALASIPDSTPGSSGNDSLTSPDDITALATRIRELSRGRDVDLHEQICLLLRFDELEGWHGTGTLHTVGWMNANLGIHEKIAREYLRVGRELRTLPVISACFRVGKLEWSKVRLLCRVADESNECELAIAAMDMNVVGCETMCRERRHPGTPSEDTLADLAMHAFVERQLSWKAIDEQSTLIRIRLPNDLAAEFLSGLSHCTDCLYESGKEREREARVELENARSTAEAADAEPPGGAEHTGPGSPIESVEPAEPDARVTARQRRADAAVLMASRSLALAGDEVAKSDRYRVVLDVDAGSLAARDDASGKPEPDERCCTGPCGAVNFPDPEPAPEPEPRPGPEPELGSEPDTEPDATPLPPKRPVIRGFGPIAVETARRIACDSGLVAIATDPNGDVLGVGRAMRLLPAKLRRAVEARDKCCSVPGCTATRFLQNHHIVGWADGGESSVMNTARVCSAHHVMLHEGGYRLERVVADDLELSPEALEVPATDAERGRARRLVAATSRYRLVAPGRGRTVDGLGDGRSERHGNDRRRIDREGPTGTALHV